MASAYDESIFSSFRRIIRAIDLHSRQISIRYKLTLPQLACMRHLLTGPCNPSDLARAVFLSQPTVTGILDRLEARGLVERQRSVVDRRKVSVGLTDEGRRITEAAPEPLQEQFAARLHSLNIEQQKDMDSVLRVIADMMDSADNKLDEQEAGDAK